MNDLIQKDNGFKKLRIIIDISKRFIPSNSTKFQFTVRSFFAIDKLYESYIQLTLNRVAIRSVWVIKKIRNQLSFKARIIPIPNICKKRKWGF